MTAPPPREPVVSPAAQSRLVDLAFARFNYGIGVMVLVSVPFIAWYAAQGHHPGGLFAWCAAYLALLLWTRALHRGFRAERARQDAVTLVRRWLPRVQTIGGLFGANMAVLPLLTIGRGSFEFQLLYLMAAGAIVAVNASQSAVLSAYRYFLFAGWGGVTLLVPFTFPQHWFYVLPLALVHWGLGLRQAATWHRFLLEHIALQEEGERLAESHRLAKEQAERALHDKNLFLTTASHDLRQPVHAMGFLVESIARRNHDPALEAPLGDLRQSVQSATQMFNALLDLSRIDSGHAPVRAEPVSLAGLLDEVVTTFRQEARARGLALRLRRPRNGATVTADPTLLRQSLTNLLHNALRYTRRGGILLAARRRGNDWRCEVWDTGIGVATGNGAEIFSPFYRHEHAWSIESAGHGLGLAVVARCCTLMGATYGLCSREERGSCFWIRLPAADAHAALVASAPTPGAADASLAGTCLVVDDDPLVRTAWTSLLQSWGLRVACVPSGRQALELVDDGWQPDAVFCDQRLRSGESGLDLLRDLLERLPHAAGAMISGELQSPELADAEEQGYLVLRKPVEPAALRALLRQWLAVRGG